MFGFSAGYSCWYRSFNSLMTISIFWLQAETRDMYRYLSLFCLPESMWMQGWGILRSMWSSSLYWNLYSQLEHWITRLSLMSFMSCSSLMSQAQAQKEVTSIDEQIVKVNSRMKTKMNTDDRGLNRSVVTKVSQVMLQQETQNSCSRERLRVKYLSVRRENMQQASIENPMKMGRKVMNRRPISRQDLPKRTVKLNLPVRGNTCGSHTQQRPQVTPSKMRLSVRSDVTLRLQKVDKKSTKYTTPSKMLTSIFKSNRQGRSNRQQSSPGMWYLKRLISWKQQICACRVVLSRIETIILITHLCPLFWKFISARVSYMYSASERADLMEAVLLSRKGSVMPYLRVHAVSLLVAFLYTINSPFCLVLYSSWLSYSKVVSLNLRKKSMVLPRKSLNSVRVLYSSIGQLKFAQPIQQQSKPLWSSTKKFNMRVNCLEWSAACWLSSTT